MINSRQREAVTSITVDAHDYPGDDDTGGLWLYLTSDLHIDSVYCYREQLIRDLDKAKRRGAMIMIFGDLFDAMQGRFDPRRTMEELRPEYRRPDYYDYVVKDVGRILAPYADNIALITRGNHELSVLKNANTDLTDRLAYVLNAEHGAHVLTGQYGGYVRMMFQNGGIPQGSRAIRYFHGAGGEAPVTRGVIQTSRQAVTWVDADIVVNGHSHNDYSVAITRERLSGKGNIYFDTAFHLRTPGYKQSYGEGTTGWDVTRGGVPKPIGGHWVRMWLESNPITTRIMMETTKQISNPEPIAPVNDIYSGREYYQE